MFKFVLFVFAIATSGQLEVKAQPGPPPPPPPPSAMMMPPPPPPPGSNCVDENGVKPKFLNDTCETDNECGYVMQCVKGICSCRDQYFPVQVPTVGAGIRYTCHQAPFLNMPCVDVCQKPLTCQAGSSNAPRPNGVSSGSKMCTCSPPAVYKDNICYLECGKDESYQNGECKKRCTANEVKTEKFGCLKKAALDEQCQDSHQCSTPYSECTAGTCQCKSGFSNNKGKCESKSYSCPYGTAVASPVQCKMVKSSKNAIPVPVSRPVPPMANAAAGFGGAVDSAPMPAGLAGEPGRMMMMPPPYYNQPQLEDTCGDDQFCMLEGNVQRSEGATGHCCPKPKSLCPVGSPHPNATCDYQKSKEKMQCPYQSHYCISSGGYGYNSESVCCPQACTNGDLLIGDKCLPRVQFGESCVDDQQCKGHNGVCNSGTCACGGDTVAEGRVMYTYCRAHCKSDEVEWNNVCYPRFKLGDKCQEGSVQCPLNGYCNAKSVCACRCGYQPLGDSICGPPATCNNPNFGRPIPMPRIMDAAASGDKSNASANAEAKSNLTYCKISPGSKSLLPGAVDQCPDGQTCTYYLQNILGICCPTPKPSCPSGTGAPLDQNCNGNKNCPMGAFCYRYYTLANATDTSSGYVCCSNGAPSMPRAID